MNTVNDFVYLPRELRPQVLNFARQIVNGGDAKQMLEAYKRQCAHDLGWLYVRQTPSKRETLLKDAKAVGLDVSFNLDMLGTPNTMGDRKCQEVKL